MDKDKYREELENNTPDGLYEIIVGGRPCLIGRAGYIDYMLKEFSICEVINNNLNLKKNESK